MATQQEREAVSKITNAKRRIARVLQPRVNNHADGGWFIRLPGFRFDDYNAAGVPRLVSIDRILLSILPRWSIKDQTEVEKVFLFYVGRQLNISERLYERAAIDLPMTLRWSVVGVGKSSFDQYIVLNEEFGAAETSQISEDGGQRFQSSNAGGDLPLVTSINRVVIVDQLTRKKTTMSRQLRDDLSSSLVSDDVRLPIIRPPPATTVDTATFTHRVKVRGDDADFHGHVNVSSYVGFAMECARIAVKSGFYSSIRDDVNFHRVKSVTSLYKAESLVDDELDVTTWENNDNSRLLNFVINKQGKLIYSSQIEFYDRFLDRSQL